MMKPLVIYKGFGDSREEACKDLERQLQLDANSGAFVTISKPKILSPRVALANIRDGVPYKVRFSRKSGKVSATVGFKSESSITSPRGTNETLF